jgi:transcription antitermination protein NusB
LNLLRLGVYELLERPEIPASVTLDEAVEIARRFGSEESAAFVNGVLDHIARQIDAPGLSRRPT